MRAVIRKAQGQQQLLRSSNQGDMYCATVNNSGSVPYLSHLPNYGNSLTNGSSFSGGDFSNLASRMCNKPSDATDSTNFSKNASPGQSSENQNFSHSNPSAINPDNSNASIEPEASPSNASNNSDSFPNSLERSKNCVSSNLIQNGNSNSNNQFQTKRHANTMLMSMLSDVPSANSSSSSFPFLNQSDSSPVPSGKSRKRKKKSDNRSPGGSTGRSPKRKMSEDDCRSTPDAEICDSPMGYDASSMPASLPSSSSEQINRSMISVDFIKTEPPSPGYPPRSTSTDSYLMHEDFQSHQIPNTNDSSHHSENSTPANSEILRGLSQVKNQYFGSNNITDFEKDYLASSESNYADDQSNTCDVESASENSSNIDSSQSSLVTKFNPEKIAKKKKSKEKSDSVPETSDMLVVKSHDNHSSDESSIGDASQKSFGDADNSQSEDLSSVSSKSSSNYVSQPIFISTSLKIAKSGDGHKVSKSEIKLKQKEGKRSSSSGDGNESSGKRKSDAKKERKRKRTEGSESSSSRSPVRSLHLNLDSSLMPPPSSSSETNTMVSSSDTQPIRPITLNVKNSPVVTSSSNFQSKSPVHSKKSSSLGSVGGSFSKSSTSKSGSSEKNVKPSPPRSSHSPSSKMNSSDSESKRSSSSVKIQSKHKQSSSSKSSSSGSSATLHGSGRSSPSKTKTLKLKNYGFPTTATLAPLITKANVSPPTSVHNSAISISSDPLIMQATIAIPESPPSKSGSNSSKANKSAPRTRKGSLSAVIDKLRNTANAQHVIPDGMDPAIARSESMVDRKESKLERKDNSKEVRDNVSLSKGSEGKSKYSSSDQFTVKQSSQGIKLTVTKTRSSDGSSKSKYKQSKNSSVSSSSSGVKSSSGSSVSKSGNVSPASKKMYPSSSSVNISISKSSNIGSSSGKLNSSNSQKTSSPSNLSSSMSPRSGISANNMSKSLSKHVSSSSQNKVSGSTPKVLDKIEKKSGDSKTSSSESKDKISTSTLNAVANLMPPPSSKQVSDSSRSSSSGNTPKRIEEPSRQSPRHTPTRDISLDESDGERAFRLLLTQSKLESSDGAEQNNMTSKSSEFITSAIDYSKMDILKKTEIDDKNQWVSSSSDIKPPSVQRSVKEVLMLDETNCISMNEIDCKSNVQMEVSSSTSKHDMVNANLVTSSEEINKAIASLSKPKQSKRANGPSDEDSSPDECLVIDYPDTPRLQMPIEEKWPSPRIDSNILNVLEDKMEKSDLTANFVNQPSLIKSPAQVLTPSNHSLSRPLSIIDDDLMNEAVMPIEK